MAYMMENFLGVTHPNGLHDGRGREDVLVTGGRVPPAVPAPPTSPRATGQGAEVGIAIPTGLPYSGNDIPHRTCKATK